MRSLPSTQFWCLRCGKAGEPRIDRQTLLRCRFHNHQTTVTAVTVLRDTRIALTVRFCAIWWATAQKSGAGTLGLQKILGLKSYEIACAGLHKLRRAMLHRGRELSSDRVEFDECAPGALEEELRGRGSADNAHVVVAVVRGNRRLSSFYGRQSGTRGFKRRTLAPRSHPRSPNQRLAAALGLYQLPL